AYLGGLLDHPLELVGLEQALRQRDGRGRGRGSPGAERHSSLRLAHLHDGAAAASPAAVEEFDLGAGAEAEDVGQMMEALAYQQRLLPLQRVDEEPPQRALSR